MNPRYSQSSFLTGCLLLACGALLTDDLKAYVYTNVYAPDGSIVLKAVDLFPNKVSLGSSRVYDGTGASSATAAANYFYNDYPIYYLDISAGITARHRALGFMDVMVSVECTPGTNLWRLMGDADDRGDADIRAVDGDGIVWDMIDTNYKPATRINSSLAALNISTTNPGNVSYNCTGGEYAIARMAVPAIKSGAYSFVLGNKVVVPGRSGQETAQKAIRYQVNLYTPQITNTLIPVISITDPFIDGTWESSFDSVARIKLIPRKTVRVTKGTQITFSARNTFNQTGKSIQTYEWSVGGVNSFAYVQGGETLQQVFATNGTYQVALRLTTPGDTPVATEGLPCDTNFAAQVPNLSPAPLPFFLEVADPPVSNTLGRPRPSPFVLGVSSELWVDFNLSASQKISLAIYTLGGTLVKNLIENATYPAGYWGVSWDGNNSGKRRVPEGIYYAVLSTPNGQDTKKIHVISW